MNTPNSYNAQTNSSGFTVVNPASSNHSEALTIQGDASVRIVILNPIGRAAGDRILATMILPETSGIEIQFRNASDGGLLLFSFTTDAVQLSAAVEFGHTGGAWYYQRSDIPA